MTWPWHVLWWLYLAAGAINLIALLVHSDRKAQPAVELIAPRMIIVGWAGFMLWFLANYAPPWAGP